MVVFRKPKNMKKLLVTLLLAVPFLGKAQEMITSPQTLCSSYAQLAWGVQPNSLLMTYDIDIDGPLEGYTLWFRVNGEEGQQFPIMANGRITYMINGVTHGPAHVVDAQLFHNGVFVTQHTLYALTYVWDRPSVTVSEVDIMQTGDTTVISGTVTVPTIYGFPESEAIMTCNEHRPVVTVWITDGADTLATIETEQYGHHVPGTTVHDPLYPFEFHYTGAPRIGTVCIKTGIVVYDNGPEPLDFEEQKIMSVEPGSVTDECGLTLLGAELSTGFGEKAGTRLSLYPNPSNNVFNIGGTSAGHPYFVTDCTGRSVMSGQTDPQSTAIDASTWSSGAYIIRVEDSIFHAVRD